MYRRESEHARAEHCYTQGVQYDDNHKQAFLDELARTGIIADALVAAGGVSRSAVRKWRENDPEFAQAYDDTLETAADALEREARRRAIEGVERRRYDKDGNITSEEVVYSDGLMALLLKANKPDKFADRSKTELSNPDGTFKRASDTEAAVRLHAILGDAKRRRDAADDDRRAG